MRYFPLRSQNISGRGTDPDSRERKTPPHTLPLGTFGASIVAPLPARHPRSSTCLAGPRTCHTNHFMSIETLFLSRHKTLNPPVFQIFPPISCRFPSCTRLMSDDSKWLFCADVLLFIFSDFVFWFCSVE